MITLWNAILIKHYFNEVKTRKYGIGLFGHIIESLFCALNTTLTFKICNVWHIYNFKML